MNTNYKPYLFGAVVGILTVLLPMKILLAILTGFILGILLHKHI